MTSILTKSGFLLLIAMLFSCSSEPSLQRYFVDSSNNPAFENVSLTPQTFIKNAESLSSEEKAKLENIEKLNVLMLKDNAESEIYQVELEKLNRILDQKQYKSLMNAGEPNKGMEMLYVGEEDEIKELIFFGHDDKMGFIVARVLGKNLSPNNLYEVFKLGDQIDMSLLQKTVEDFAG
jgi:hypothetical protein